MLCIKAERQESRNSAGHRETLVPSDTCDCALSSQFLLVYNKDLANLEVFQVCLFELDTLSQKKRGATSLPT